MDRARPGGAEPWVPVLVAPNFLGDFIIFIYSTNIYCVPTTYLTLSWALGQALAYRTVTVPVLLELMAEWGDRLQEIDKQPALQTFISQTLQLHIYVESRKMVQMNLFAKEKEI